MNRATGRPWIAGALLLGVLASGCDSPGHGSPGVSWPVDAGPGSAEPHLAGGHGGPVILSWLEPAPPGTALRYATFGAEGWSAPRTLREGHNWFVNWADFPSVVPVSESLWAAHWLVKQPGKPYAYDVAVAVSADAGATWMDEVVLHDDGTLTEHGFVSLFPWQEGIGAVWLDGREMTAHGDNMTLRSAVVGADSRIRQPALVDALVCDCCQTDVAVASSGPVVAYRNRTAGEIRDIYTARAVEGEWQPGRPVADDGWRIAGCPVNGPAIAADGDLVVVAWFTAAGHENKVRVAFSSDSAASFAPAIDVATGHPMGRVDVALHGGDAIVSWLDTPAGDAIGDLAELRVRRVASTGAAGATRLIAKTGAGRPAGFPQMLLAGDQLLFAWTDTREEHSRVRSAAVAAAGIR